MFNVFAIAAAVLALTAPFGGPPPTAEYKYTANHHGAGGSIFEEPDSVLAGTPVGRVALAHIRVKPSGRSFTLNIDDFVTPDGRDVAVYVLGDGRIFEGCVPVGKTTTITGTTPGKEILISIGERAIPHVTGCSGVATAGVATLGGVKPLPK
jgi:hypothetical protein